MKRAIGSIIIFIFLISIFSTHASDTQPTVRTSEYKLLEEDLGQYIELKAQPQRAAPSNASLLSEMVGLTVDTPQQTRTITLKEKESFLTLDGSSQSLAIGVKYEIVYPNGTKEEFDTNAENPFHLLVKEPPAGTYKIVLTTITTGNTTAWIQAATLNKGVSFIDTLEKEHLHLTAGQAKYFKIKVREEWTLFHISKIAGSSINLNLMQLPTLEVIKTQVDTFSRFYVAGELVEGEYIFSITNRGHTDVSIIMANPKAVVNILNLDEGKRLGFQIPSDVEFFWLNVPENIGWFSFDGALDSSSGTGRYTLYDPEFIVILNSETRSEAQLIHDIWKNPKHGTYLLLVWGFDFPSVTLKFTTKYGIKDFSGSLNISLKILFRQSGQSLYINLKSQNSSALLAALNDSFWSYSVHNLKGETLEFDTGNYFGKFIGAMLKGYNENYYIRIQAQKGGVIFYLRARGGEDYNVDTPDYTDLKFRFKGDAIFFNVSLRGCNYFAQYYASLNDKSFNKFWIVDENSDLIWEGSLEGQGRFLQMWRVGYELDRCPKGNWLTIVISNTEGVNVRLSQLQTGDEQLKDTPYHEFHAFDFDYQLKIVKISIPETRWMVAITFTLTESPAEIYFLDSQLRMVETHYCGPEISLRYSFWENVPEGSWIMSIAGLQTSNVSLSIVTHENLLSNITGFVRVVISGDIARLQQEVETYKKELQKLEAKLNETENEKSALKEEIESLKSKIEDRERKIEELQHTIEILKGESEIPSGEGKIPRLARIPYLLPYGIDELFMFAQLIPFSKLFLPLLLWVVIGFAIGLAIKWKPKSIALLFMLVLVLFANLLMNMSVLEITLGLIRFLPLYIIPCLIGVKVALWLNSLSFLCFTLIYVLVCC